MQSLMESSIFIFARPFAVHRAASSGTGKMTDRERERERDSEREMNTIHSVGAMT